MAIPISYNLRNATQRPMSTLATTLGIALVVAILVGALALASGFQAALVETGSPENLIVLRTGADSEISSAIIGARRPGRSGSAPRARCGRRARAAPAGPCRSS